MDMQKIEGSSLIAATGHDPETSTMHIEFNDGSVHAYAGVTPETHDFLRSGGNLGSVGKTFHRHIKAVYAATPVEAAHASDGPEA